MAIFPIPGVACTLAVPYPYGYPQVLGDIFVALLLMVFWPLFLLAQLGREP